MKDLIIIVLLSIILTNLLLKAPGVVVYKNDQEAWQATCKPAHKPSVWLSHRLVKVVSPRGIDKLRASNLMLDIQQSQD